MTTSTMNRQKTKAAFFNRSILMLPLHSDRRYLVRPTPAKPAHPPILAPSRSAGVCTQCSWRRELPPSRRPPEPGGLPCVPRFVEELREDLTGHVFFGARQVQRKISLPRPVD